MNSNLGTLAVLGLAMLIGGCGAQTSDSGQSNNSDQGSVVSLAEVKSEPAFLKRGCDGNQSPPQFCPK